MTPEVERFVIRLDNLRFRSRIGVMEQERTVGNEFMLDIAMTLGAGEFVAERLDTTVSYADVYASVAEIMREEHLLLETVAKTIADTILTRWEKIYAVSVKITKLSVPVVNMSGQASVEFFSEKKLS